MQRWLACSVIALCSAAYAQSVGDEAHQRILRALRSFNRAQALYRVYGKGLACRLEQLGPPQKGANPSAQAAGLIDRELASGQFAGYQIRLNCTADDYQVTAVPTIGVAGAVWCVDKSAVLRTSASADTCISEGRVMSQQRLATAHRFSKTPPTVAQETQAREYWIDPTDGLMWAARDSGKPGSWHKAMKYCRNLRLAGYSDWRLATIDELESLVDLSAYATEYVGSSDILHRNSELQVSGGLLLTYGRQWSSTPTIEANGHPSSAHFWSFWFDEGRRWAGFEDILEGDTMNALCVRNPKPRTK